MEQADVDGEPLRPRSEPAFEPGHGTPQSGGYGGEQFEAFGRRRFFQTAASAAFRFAEAGFQIGEVPPLNRLEESSGHPGGLPAA